MHDKQRSGVALPVTEPSHAVFLSYASEDAAAADRVATALRAAGIEVWFDQSELRGGDVWDQRIRREIRTCTLFMPVISANTASRHEGYFRLEWDLADQRTHMMARDRAFIVPVCLDATKEAGTDVPESFHRVQWTRLLDGNTPPAFTARIVALLAAAGAVASSAESTHPAAKTGHVAPPALALTATLQSALRRNRLAIALMATIAVVLAYVAVDRLWLSKRTPAEKPAAAVAPAPIPAAPAIPGKSVAVLPFVNMSEDKNNEYFSDGLSEELIDMLTKVPELHVPARTSSFYFKGKQATVPDIAKALSVSHVLEGSVRKSGNHLRITAQLVRADNGYHLWSESYDRELDDIFKVQDEIASAVVKALKVSLMQGTASRPIPTSNTEAYTLYLQARAVALRAGPGDYQTSVGLLRRTLVLDARFAAAWAALANDVIDDFNWNKSRPVEDARAEAYEAAAKALELDPNLSDGHLARAKILHWMDWNWDAAEAEFRQTLVLAPSNAEALRANANLAQTIGLPDRQQELAQRAVAADPLDSWNYYVLGLAHTLGGKPKDAAVSLRKALELNPTGVGLHATLGRELVVLGDPAAGLAEIAREDNDFFRLMFRPYALEALGRKVEADADIAATAREYGANRPGVLGRWYECHRDFDRASFWFDRAYRQRDTSLLWADWCRRSLLSDPRYLALRRKVNLPE